MIFLALLLTMCGAIIFVAPLRRILITRPIMRLFAKAMPVLSSTEETSITAGSVWWEGELFSGKPDYDQLFAMPAPRLSPTEQAFLDGPVEQLCGMLDDWHITHERLDLPPAVWAFIREQHFFGMVLPSQYGGLGFSNYAHAKVVTKIATRSVSAAVTVMVPNSLGPGELLLHYGTPEQKDFYLPRLANGLEIPCFALTSPDAGSDAGAISDYGVVCRGDYIDPYTGQEHHGALGVQLNWEKRYITLGPVATVLGLTFNLYDPDHLLGIKKNIGISCALIPTHYPGVQIGRRHFPASAVFQNGPTRGCDVFIPIDWLIGGSALAGQGWRMLMECLSIGRTISLPAMAVASGKLASYATGAYARIRSQFGQPIGKFEGVQEALVRIAGYTYQMEAAQKLALAALDAGEKPSVLSAILKYHTTERMRSVLNDAMDVHGGKAVCLGPHNVLGRLYQAVPIAITVEGANILTRSMMIFGQGAIRCHPWLLAEVRAVAQRDLRGFDHALWRHVRHVLANTVRALGHGLTGGRLACSPVQTGPMRVYWQHLSRLSACFAFVSEVVLLRLGGKLKFRERLSARMGDVLAALYLASAVLKAYHDEDNPEARVLVRWAVEDALYDGQQALVELLANLPERWLGGLLRWLMFPWGLPERPPADTLGGPISNLIMAPTQTRERLIEHMYRPEREDDPIGGLDHALRAVMEAEMVESKFRAAVRQGKAQGHTQHERLVHAQACGALDAHEAQLLQTAWAARRRVIMVDEFDSHLHQHLPDAFERHGV